MTPARTALQLTALAGTTTMPRVVRHLARAAHGPKPDRPEQLRQARHHVIELLAKIDVAAAELEREPKDDAA